MSFKDLEETIVGLTLSVLGMEVSYTRGEDSPVTIKGVFDNAWVDVDGVVSLRPTLRIALADLDTEPARQDEVTIDETDYIVSESRLDGFGGTTLILKKA
jgi:hypothetical protein